MEREDIFVMIIVSFAGAFIMSMLWHFKKAIEVFKQIADDTLKRKDDAGILRWSRTSLTMFSAWCASLFMAIDDLAKNGFRYEVFLTLVGIALGSKLTDSLGKRLSPETPKDDKPKNEQSLEN